MLLPIETLLLIETLKEIYMETKTSLKTLPDQNGYFGEYGGSFVPEQLTAILQEIADEYEK